MFEYPEYSQNAKETKDKGIFGTMRRFRTTKQKLVDRADSLKGKDEMRRQKLLKVADNMNGDKLSTKQIRRKTLIAELDLLIDDMKNRG